MRCLRWKEKSSLRTITKMLCGKVIRYKKRAMPTWCKSALPVFYTLLIFVRLPVSVLLLSKAFFIKWRIKSIEVLAVQSVGQYTKCFAEPLIMHNLSCPQKAYRVKHIRIITKPQNIVVGCSRFLLRKRCLNSSYFYFILRWK